MLKNNQLTHVPRILITGAAGFLGSHLCDRFIKEGYEVVGMDNLITGNIQNIEHLFPLKEFSFYHHDVTKFVHVPGNIDYILHFASPASPIDYLKMPIQTLKVGALGTHNLLGLAKAKGARILVASTSEVYGDPLVHPQTEEYWGNVNPIGIRSCYDEGKRIAETLMTDYHRQNNVDIRIARIFNTYGPRMLENDGRVVSNFLVRALAVEPVTLYGEGQQTRFFFYVDDLVEGMIRLMNVEGVHEPVNLGNPGEFTIMQLAEEVVKICDSNSGFTHLPLPADDPRQRKPNIGKAQSLLGWNPTIPLREGLKKTVEDFKARVNV